MTSMRKKVLYMGPDISVHQGVVNIKKIRDAGYKRIALRAGYGQNNIDQKFITNAQACYNLNVPTMIYWFSYALTPEMAAKEAEYAIAQTEKFWTKCPIAFDLEYDTIRYARTKGVEISKSVATEMSIAFLKKVKEKGHTPVIYTNKDYLKNYFDMNKVTKEVGEVFVWYARYASNLPASEEDVADIWQFSSKERIDGVSGNVDMNRFYTDFECVKINETKPSVTCNINILNFQKAANADGYLDKDGKSLVEDGIDGEKTQYVRKQICLQAKKVKGVWSIGTQGEIVKWFQTRCNEVLAHNQKVDGLYGNASRTECISVQRKLQLTADGKAGYNTLQALFYN